MKYIYIVTKGYDYEGEEVCGAYTTLSLARKNLPAGGDSQHIHRLEVDTANDKEMPLTRGGIV